MNKLSILLLLILLLALSGCSDNTTVPDTENGRVEVPGEAQKLLEKYAVPVAIPTADEELVVEGNTVSPPYSKYDVYAVTLLWGSLLNVSANGGGPTIDFSGTVGINGVSTIDVTHLIDFEANQDSLIPTNVPSVVAWASHTTSDFDGINCLIYLDNDIVYITAPMLTFQTQPFTRAFNFSELEHLDAFYWVDNTTAVAIHARKLYSSTCPSGIVLGEWIRADIGGATGTIQATWWNENNGPFAVMSGNFWSESDGTRLFEAWVSHAATPVIQYHVYGSWFYDDYAMCPLCGSRHGKFAGFYTDNSGKLRGIVYGEFGNWTQDPLNNHLPITGTWRELCGNADYIDYSTSNWIK